MSVSMYPRSTSSSVESCLTHKLIHGECLSYLSDRRAKFDCIFADPPDNINLAYGEYTDNVKDYEKQLWKWLLICMQSAPIVWFSFNSRWLLDMAVAARVILTTEDWEFKAFVQTFTFGQNNSRDCGNGHRPLWRFKHKSAKIYPEHIKVPSWRELHGDKRAAPGGRVPLDVWDFPRVTGNSKQRRSWHPTQLNEDLVERAILMSTLPGQSVCDPFGGTGTTLRVCKKINRSCTLVEIDGGYCDRIEEEHPDVHRFTWPANQDE